MSDPREIWARLAGLTPARIGLGRAGSGLPTREVLRFGLDHAQARDAVHAPMDAEALAGSIAALGFATIPVASQAPDRRPTCAAPISAAGSIRPICRSSRPRPSPADLALVVADGLSARAVHENAAPLLKAFKPWRSSPAGASPPW